MSAGRIPKTVNATRTEAIRRLRYSMDFTQLYNRLLQNHPFAKRYFSKANISQHINARRVKEGLFELFKNFPDHLLEIIHDMDQLKETSPKELLAEASKYIGEFLEGNGFNGEKAAMTTPSNLQEEAAFLRDPAAFFVRKYLSANNRSKNDLLQLCSNIISGITVYKEYPAMKSRLGEYFRKFYVIMLAGELVANNTLPITSPPLSRNSVDAVPAASDKAAEKQDLEHVDTVIRRPILPIIGYSKRNGTARYGDFVKSLLSEPQRPEIKAAIERAIKDYNKIRADGEAERSLNTFIGKLSGRDPGANATNYYEREEAYNQSVGLAQDILGAWKPGQNTKELQRLITLTLVLIRYPE